MECEEKYVTVTMVRKMENKMLNNIESAWLVHVCLFQNQMSCVTKCLNYFFIILLSQIGTWSELYVARNTMLRVLCRKDYEQVLGRHSHLVAIFYV